MKRMAIQTGALIAQLRREKDLTQKQLADALHVTDKAVSRWETGKGLPDTALLPPLAEVLGVTVTELLAGQRVQPEQQPQQTRQVLLETLEYARGMRRRMAAAMLAVFGALLLFAPLVLASAGPGGGLLALCGGAFLLLAILLRLRRRPFGGHRALWLAAAFHTAAVALCAVPGGAVCVFADGPEKRIVQTFPCFSLTPFGYANFFPLLCALLASAVLLMLLWRLTRRTGNGGAALCCTLVAGAVFLLSPLLFGRQYLTPVGVGILCCLLLSAACQTLNRGENQ